MVRRVREDGGTVGSLPFYPATDRLPFGNVVGGVFFLDVLNYGHTRTAGEDRNVDLGAETGRS